MRARKNHHEHRFEETARAAGWYVTKRGWPDFVCWRTGGNGKPEFLFVEVKPESKSQKGRYQRPSQPQMLVLAALHEAGFEVRISDGSDLGAKWSHALLAKKVTHTKDWDGRRKVSKRIRDRDQYTESVLKTIQNVKSERQLTQLQGIA